MERICHWTIAVLIAFQATGVSAGTILLSPPPAKPLDAQDTQYPESRFGSPPAKVDLGITQGYASKQSEDWDSGNPVGANSNDGSNGSWSNGVSANRSPAGLEFSGQGKSATASQTPSSGAEAKVEDSTKFSIPSPDSENMEIRKKGVQEIALIAGDLGYFPRTIFVTRDIPVRLYVTGSSKHTLCLMMDSFHVRKQVRSQKVEEILFTPSAPGKYRFYCPVNGMEGTLIVKELSTNLTASNN